MTTIIESPRTPLYGGWMWYGDRTYSLAEFTQLCVTAREWGMTGIHPKVYDGLKPWYNDAALKMMKEIANQAGLHIAPFHFCYGNNFGSSVAGEAEIAAYIGSIFGAVCPDMEDQWVNQPAWAQEFGVALRQTHKYAGLAIPTVYANPAQHPESIAVMNVWANGFLPQVYFSIWTPNTASHALAYILPEWRYIGQQVENAYHMALKPLMPIVSTGNGLPVSEVIAWIALSRQSSNLNTDYIGFWYDETYAPYALSLKSSLPVLHSSEPPSPPVQQKGPLPTMPQPIWNQGFTPAHHASLWKKNGDIPYNPTFAIPLYWANLLDNHEDIPIGSPVNDEHDVVIGGYKWRIQTFELAGGAGIVSLLYEYIPGPTQGKVYLYYGSEEPRTLSEIQPAPSANELLSSSSVSVPVVASSQVL